MLEKVKLSLRIVNDAFDEEINTLIEAAKKDLEGAGVVISASSDPLIERAIILYAKSNFGMANPDSEKYDDAYHNLRQKLSLNGDYNVLV